MSLSYKRTAFNIWRKLKPYTNITHRAAPHTQQGKYVEFFCPGHRGGLLT